MLGRKPSVLNRDLLRDLNRDLNRCRYSVNERQQSDCTRLSCRRQTGQQYFVTPAGQTILSSDIVGSECRSRVQRPAKPSNAAYADMAASHSCWLAAATGMPRARSTVLSIKALEPT